MSAQPEWRAACRLTAGGLLLFHAWVVLSLIPRWSVTRNEVGHIPAGLACWYNGAFDLYNVNPPLPRMVATASLLNQPGICLEALSRVRDRPGERQESEVGTFFADTNALDYHRIVCRARLAGVFWVTLGGFIVWWWSGRIFGPIGGLVALALWTFEPTLTAHAVLATPDVPATVMGLAATYAFAHVLREGTWFHTYVAGLLLGGALLCKFTLVLLVPAWAFAWLMARHRLARHAVHPVSARAQLARMLSIGLLAWLTLNSAYGFSGTGTRLGRLAFVSKSFRKASGRLEGSWVGTLPCPLPSAYVRGLDVQQRDFEGRLNSYMRGEWRDRGWWYYYIYAFGVKAPLGHIAVYGLALLAILFLRQPVPPLLWVPPALIVAAASLKSGFTNHLRYILPAYPFVMISSGVLASRAFGGVRGLRSLLVVGLVSWSASTMFCAYPNLLGYFNETVGGPREGWRHLAESNVDWGQDLILLRDWLAAHPDARPIQIALDTVSDKRIYLRQQYSLPHDGMSGYAAVDTSCLSREFRWLLAHRVVARIGTSIFVFEVRS